MGQPILISTVIRLSNASYWAVKELIVSRDKINNKIKMIIIINNII